MTAVIRPLNLAKSRFLALTEERGRVMAHPCNLDTIDGNLRWYLCQPCYLSDPATRIWGSAR